MNKKDKNRPEATTNIHINNEQNNNGSSENVESANQNESDDSNVSLFQGESDGSSQGSSDSTKDNDLEADGDSDFRMDANHIDLEPLTYYSPDYDVHYNQSRSKRTNVGNPPKRFGYDGASFKLGVPAKETIFLNHIKMLSR